MAPVAVTLLADEGRILRYTSPVSYEEFFGLHPRLATLFLRATVGVSGFHHDHINQELSHYQKQQQVISPCPDTALNIGRMLTHKNFVIRLCLQGLSVLEIARPIYQSPRSVDAYLKEFDSVLVLHLYDISPSLMATVLRRGESLIREYLELIETYLKDADIMRDYLRKRGVHIPVKIPYSG
jgi:hypothetical protein